MSATGSGYDLSVTTFSPDGRVFQVEYADKAVEKSGTAIGIRCKDGVVLGVEKVIISKLLVKGSNRRIAAVDLHAGLAMSGMSADGRQLVNKARSECQDYRSFYGTEIPGSVLADRLAGHVHMHTLYWYLRPYGIATLLATYDEATGPELYTIQPSGVCHRYYASAVGKGKQGAKTELEKIDFKTITCRDAVKEIAKIIYKVHDDVKDKPFELELSWVCDESKRRHVFVPEDLRQEAIRLAKEEKEKAEIDSDDDDDDDDDDDEGAKAAKKDKPKADAAAEKPKK